MGNTLRQQHSALKSELQREKARERALEQENALLKTWMDDKVKKMEELRKASSEMLVEYYKKKGTEKNALPPGFEDNIKPQAEKEEEREEKDKEEEEEERTVAETTSPKTPLKE